jgi:hypothetical protein
VNIAKKHINGDIQTMEDAQDDKYWSLIIDYFHSNRCYDAIWEEMRLPNVEYEDYDKRASIDQCQISISRFINGVTMQKITTPRTPTNTMPNLETSSVLEILDNFEDRITTIIERELIQKLHTILGKPP